MKKVNLFIIIMLCVLSKAQVGINTTSPNASSTLDVIASNKGVSFPKINIDKKNTTTPVTNPKESLIVYNTNSSLIGGLGFYFWNGNVWDFMFNDLNANLLQNMMKYASATTTNIYSSNSYNATTSSIGETLSSSWVVLADLTKTLTVDRTPNNTLFITSGMLSVNNNSAGIVLLHVGIFVDDKLVDIKPIYMNLVSSCDYRTFKVIGTTSDLAVGNRTIKFAIKNYSESVSSQTPTINYGSVNSGCSNLSNDEASISGVIILNQPFNF